MRFADLNLAAAKALDPELTKAVFFQDELGFGPITDIDLKNLVPIPDNQYLSMLSDAEEAIKTCTALKANHEKKVKEIRALQPEIKPITKYLGFVPFAEQQQNTFPDGRDIYVPLDSTKYTDESLNLIASVKQEDENRPKVEAHRGGIVALLDDPEFRAMLEENELLNFVEEQGYKELLKNADNSNVDAQSALKDLQEDPALASILANCGALVKYAESNAMEVDKDNLDLSA